MAALFLSLFGRPDRPFLVPAKTASASGRSRRQGRPLGRRATRASLDGGEHGRTLPTAGILARTSRARRAAMLAFFGVLGVAVLAGPAAAAAPAWRSDSQIIAAIDEAAARFGLPRTWIMAVIAVESGGKPRAVSVKGAMGLMQLMPAAWAEMRSEFGLGADPFDRRDNILAGAGYLRRLYDRFGADGAFAAYNAGPGRFADHLVGGRLLPAETRAYVATIQRRLDPRQGELVEMVRAPTTDWRTAPLFVAAPEAAATEVEERP